MRANVRSMIQNQGYLQAHYKHHYYPEEAKLLTYIVDKTTENDIKLIKSRKSKLFAFTIPEIANILDASPQRIESLLEELSRDLVQRTVIIKDNAPKYKSPHFDVVSLLSSFSYDSSKATVEVSYKLISWILHIKHIYGDNGGWKYTLRFTSGYAVNLYYFLQSNLTTSGELIVSVDDIKKLMGIDHNKTYDYYSNFKRKVLDISLREINDKSNMHLSYDRIKDGKKIVQLKFKIIYK